ncbi:MAG: imelysin family protein [Pseudomonadota bacterium]
MRFAVLALCLLPTIATAQSRLASDEAALLQAGLSATADAFILPSYVAQAEAAANLTDGLAAFCSGSGPKDDVTDAYAALFLAWQRSSAVQVGPIMEAEGPMRVQLWPDPKGFSRRAVRAALLAEDPALLTDGGLEGRSIALVNLTALEHLIYGDLTPRGYACDLAIAITAFQQDLAAELLAAWQPDAEFRQAFDTALDGNEQYDNVDALIREFLAGLVVYTDRIRKFKIERGLGPGKNAARPERTEAAASGQGLPSLLESHRALSDLYNVPGGFFDATSVISGEKEHFVLGLTAANVANSLASETQSLTDIAAADGPAAAELRRFGELMTYHEAFLKTGLAKSLGLTTGFTSADGD